MTFDQYLKHLMDERDMSATRLSVTMEDHGKSVSVQTVESWMRGGGFPRYEYIAPLAKSLDVDPNALFGWDDRSVAATGTEG